MAVLFSMRNNRTIDPNCQFNVFRYTRIPASANLTDHEPCGLCIIPVEPQCDAPVTFATTTMHETPAGRFWAIIECIGAGGGGERQAGSLGGGGGGGGALAIGVVAVTPGVSELIVVGLGGNEGGIAQNGTASYFRDPAVVFAPGGKGAGQEGQGSGGRGGQADDAVGDIVRSGGDGGNAVSGGAGAGGGSAAGPDSDGEHGSSNSGPIGGEGGASVSGGSGAGGPGGANGANGTNGGLYGGGGGGSGDTEGGDGAPGLVRITYCVNEPLIEGLE